MKLLRTDDKRLKEHLNTFEVGCIVKNKTLHIHSIHDYNDFNFILVLFPDIGYVRIDKENFYDAIVKIEKHGDVFKK